MPTWIPTRSQFSEISKSQKSERDTLCGLSRPDSPVPQTMYWSQTESDQVVGQLPTISAEPPPLEEGVLPESKMYKAAHRGYKRGDEPVSEPVSVTNKK